MPRLRALNTYPHSYWDKFHTALAEPVIIKMPRPTMAETLRINLYNYRTALRNAAKHDAELAKRALLIDSVQISRVESALILHNSNWESFL